VILIGNLGRDPEIPTFPDGTRFANLSVATSESWRDKASGECTERTEWHRVALLDQRFTELAEEYLRKGSKVYLEGAVQTRKWTDNSPQAAWSPLEPAVFSPLAHQLAGGILPAAPGKATRLEVKRVKQRKTYRGATAIMPLPAFGVTCVVVVRALPGRSSLHISPGPGSQLKLPLP
jgi:hypothetical protein